MAFLSARLFSSQAPKTIRPLDRLLKSKAPIAITPTAITQLKTLLDKNKNQCPAPAGILIGIKRRGCNGLSYRLQYYYPKDIHKYRHDIHTQDNVNFVVEPQALMMIVGTKMDYETTALSSEFTFTNPQSKGSCGRGESFNI